MDTIGRLVGEAHYLCSSNVDDICGTHAMGLFHKLIVCLNEMNISDTKNHTNRLKSLISEGKLVFNPKNCQPFETDNYALIIITSNENLPARIDIASGDRRWFVWESNIINTKFSQKDCEKIYKVSRTEEFDADLYYYFNTLKSEDFDFKQAKYRNSKTKSYNKVASYFVPLELLFIKDCIMKQLFMSHRICLSDFKGSRHNEGENVQPEDKTWSYEDDDIDDFEELHYYSNNLFYEDWKVSQIWMMKQFRNWCRNNGFKHSAEKGSRGITGSFIKHNLQSIQQETAPQTRRQIYTINPCDYMVEIINRNFYSEDISKYKKLKKKEDVFISFDDIYKVKKTITIKKKRKKKIASSE